MVRAIREREVREEFVKRCEEVLRKTKRKVRVGERERNSGWREGQDRAVH